MEFRAAVSCRSGRNTRFPIKISCRTSRISLTPSVMNMRWEARGGCPVALWTLLKDRRNARWLLRVGSRQPIEIQTGMDLSILVRERSRLSGDRGEPVVQGSSRLVRLCALFPRWAAMQRTRFSAQLRDKLATPHFPGLAGGILSHPMGAALFRIWLVRFFMRFRRRTLVDRRVCARCAVVMVRPVHRPCRRRRRTAPRVSRA